MNPYVKDKLQDIIKKNQDVNQNIPLNQRRRKGFIVNTEELQKHIQGKEFK